MCRGVAGFASEGLKWTQDLRLENSPIKIGALPYVQPNIDTGKPLLASLLFLLTGFQFSNANWAYKGCLMMGFYTTSALNHE